MKIKIFAILIGTFMGLWVYSLIGYLFTKKLPLGKKYQLKLAISFFLFIFLIILYLKMR